MGNSGKRRVTWDVIVKRVLFSRTFFVILLLCVQFAVLFLPFRQLTTYSLLSAVMIVFIVNKRANPDFKLAWIIPIAILPIFGALIYLFFKVQPSLIVMKRRARKLDRHRLTGELPPPDGLCRFLARLGFPAYSNTAVQYYSMGDAMVRRMLEDLEKAREFIFLQYFIVAEGEVWDRVREILVRKAAEGVEVRLMMDGLGILGRLPENVCQQLEQQGVACRIFSPIHPLPSSVQNNRLHRKILVVDGKVGFTGGINLADEYANLSVPHEWKDGGVRLEGDAVISLVSIFLKTWELQEKEDSLPFQNRYLRPFPVQGEGYVVPFADSPFDEVDVGKRVYLDLINRAERTVRVMTPYLILDSELLEGLKFAAARGVEVELLLPGKSDSRLLNLAGISYYRELAEAGVRLLRYQPGMVHAKLCVADGVRAVAGTINLDYRSLFLNLECACYFCNCPAVTAAEQDFLSSRQSALPITPEQIRAIPLYQRLASRVLRLFAPLL